MHNGRVPQRKVRMGGGKLVLEIHWEEKNDAGILAVKPADETVWMECTVRGKPGQNAPGLQVTCRSNPVTRASIMLNRRQCELRARLESFQLAVAGFFQEAWMKSIPEDGVDLREDQEPGQEAGA